MFSFLLTRLCEARPLIACIIFPYVNFYSRASARRDHHLRRLRRPLHPFLLTRLCEARHDETWLTPQECIISTHAPLRGATELQKLIDVAIEISTHAPLRGATRRPTPTSRRQPHFYSRASARRDLCRLGHPQDRRHFYSRASARRDSTSDSDV